MEFIPANPLLEFHSDSLEVIRKIYDLDGDGMAQYVNILEDWVQKQSHFKKKHFGRDYYERTIITCKGSVEKAKTQIDKLCTYKTLLPKYFICNDLKKIISNVNNTICCIPLPKMTKEYQRIFFVKAFGSKITSPDIFLDYLRLNVMVAEYLKAHDYTDGFVVVSDFRDANMAELLKRVNFIDLQQITAIIIEGFGARMSGIHLISSSKLIEIFAKTVKSVLSAKIANRLHVHQDMDNIHKFIDKELLPVDFGGCEKPLRELQDIWMEEICSEKNQKYLEEMVESRTDESVRQINVFNENYMGLPGSFRTLNVD